MDDEENVRSVVTRMLTRHGYQVLQAESPAKAEEVLARTSGNVALLLTDVVMSGASGPRLYQRLVSAFPSLKVLFMSGYDDQATMTRDVKLAGLPFIQKPMDMDELARKVREMLD